MKGERSAGRDANAIWGRTFWPLHLSGETPAPPGGAVNCVGRRHFIGFSEALRSNLTRSPARGAAAAAALVQIGSQASPISAGDRALGVRRIGKLVAAIIWWRRSKTFARQFPGVHIRCFSVAHFAAKQKTPRGANETHGNNHYQNRQCPGHESPN